MVDHIEVIFNFLIILQTLIFEKVPSISWKVIINCSNFNVHPNILIESHNIIIEC